MVKKNSMQQLKKREEPLIEKPLPKPEDEEDAYAIIENIADL